MAHPNYFSLHRKHHSSQNHHEVFTSEIQDLPPAHIEGILSGLHFIISTILSSLLIKTLSRPIRDI
jgi:hypothetical protein